MSKLQHLHIPRKKIVTINKVKKFRYFKYKDFSKTRYFCQGQKEFYK